MSTTDATHRHARHVGRNLRDRRLAAGLTQAELAAMLDCDRRQVSEWERGVWTPSALNLEHLASALSCAWTDLYRRRDD